ncbi:MAG: ROK family protein [Ktedonobacteraceae bacterium]
MQDKETLAHQADDEQLPLVIGVDLGGTQIRAAVMRGATLLSRVGLLTGENPAPERIMPRVFAAIQEALEQANVSIADVAGIGIAAPGPLDSKTGVVFAPPNMPGWDHVPLRDIFSEQYHMPIFVENDANASGLGEYMFGAGRGCHDMVYMTISTGIGGGIISEGRIIEGASGTAGELGHMTIDWHGTRCNCGNIGCLEYFASGTGIARKANEIIHAGEGNELLTFARTMLRHSSTVPNQAALPMQGNDATTIEMRWPPTEDEMGPRGTLSEEEELQVNARTVALAAEAGIPIARAIVQNAAEALGVGLVNIIHCFNPEMIILGGGVTQMGPMLMEPALRIVQERAMKIPRERVQIVLAHLGTNTGLVGAGALIYYHANN